MQFIDIKDSCVTLRLTPQQCASLAKACQFAGYNTLSDDIDHWRTFASLFYACSVAGYSQAHMCPSDADAADNDLKSIGLLGGGVEQIDILKANGKQ